MLKLQQLANAVTSYQHLDDVNRRNFDPEVFGAIISGQLTQFPQFVSQAEAIKNRRLDPLCSRPELIRNDDGEYEEHLLHRSDSIPPPFSRCSVEYREHVSQTLLAEYIEYILSELRDAVRKEANRFNVVQVDDPYSIDLDFIRNEAMRKELKIRWADCITLLLNGSQFSATILLGSIVEGVLTDFQHSCACDRSAESGLPNSTFCELIKEFENNVEPDPQVLSQLHDLREVRNTIHPRKAIQTGLTHTTDWLEDKIEFFRRLSTLIRPLYPDKQ